MHDDGHFNKQVAANYDESWAKMFDPGIVNPVVDFLAGLASDCSALELGIGTGRIALPLTQRGVEVHGIEISKSMIAQLRVKPGGKDIDVTIGDFATARVGRSFTVAYLVFNTIMNLTTQEAQIACFRNVAAHLQPGGCFVIEVVLPDLQRLPTGETVQAWEVSDKRLGFDEYKASEQGLTSHHFNLVDGNWEYFSMPFRYVWPSELDLMAELAGMKLRERWSGWQREPFTSDSRRLVAVWEKRPELD